MTIDNTRVFILAALFALIGGLIVVRLGYLQIMQHDYFSVLADETHVRKFEIPAQRGEILMQDRDGPTPVALNRNRKTLYADTRYIYDADKVLSELQAITGEDYREEISDTDGYVELEEELDFAQAEAIEEQELSGVGLSDNYVRDYPEAELAAQTLGFVNHDDEGQYGVEEYFDEQLRGVPGMFDAQTDSQGIPLATKDNIQQQPEPGADVVLNLDRNLQYFMESALEEAVTDKQAESAHGMVMEVETGAVLAMGNYPSFDPNQYHRVDSHDLYQNAVVSSQFEPGSGFKMFTMAAGLDSDAVSPDTTYEDEGRVEVADSEIRNVLASQGTTDMREVIVRSLNTGAVYVLESLGENAVDEEAKQQLYEYFSDRFALDEPTGIDMPGEVNLNMHTPESVGPVEYANMSFGQGVATSMVRMTTSMAALVNDGVMYKPRVIDYYQNGDDVYRSEPEVAAEYLISAETSQQLRAMMQEVVDDGGGFGAGVEGYTVGGKTGTAEIPDGAGGYFDDRYIGTFTGFAPVEDPQYVMMVRLDDPQTDDFAGNDAARVFGDIMEDVLQYRGVQPADN